MGEAISEGRIERQKNTQQAFKWEVLGLEGELRPYNLNYGSTPKRQAAIKWAV